jgi:uroporphyrinogen decarboxylase
MAQGKILIRALQGEVTERVPFWFMRQAGRYLPEYRELRKKAVGFLELVFDPVKAAEVTLQPIRRFGMDGAILFSDILVIPHALGIEVHFAEGEGPIVEQVRTQARTEMLAFDEKKLKPVEETIRLVRQDLPKETALIGFAGAPWTVASYVLREKGDKEFASAREFAYAQSELMHQLIETITDATIIYLRRQADAGVEALQLFDSWAGLLAPSQFRQWVIAPTAKIVAALKQSHPQTPLIGFPRGAGQHLAAYAKTGVDCIGVDQQTEMAQAIKAIGQGQGVQGNLDPLLVAADRQAMLKEAAAILEAVRHTPAVFNFGHGMQPHTPVEHVAALCDFLKRARR